MTRAAATVSVDLDPVDLHLLGYGVRDLPPDPLVYTAAVPRLLDAFARHGVRATWFCVGRDAAAQHAAIAAIAAAGHEVASHTHTHPMAFARLPAARITEELAASRAALTTASRTPVLGFRAPNFDVDLPTLGRVAAAGYTYDASAYPTAFLVPARVLLAVKSRDPAGVMALRPWPWTWERHPHRIAVTGGSLAEFPVAVTPGVRFPVYHTARYVLDRARFERMLDGFVARGESLSYPLHAVDALGLREDRVDPRLAGHPGMGRPLDPKLALLDESLAAIAARFEPRTFAARTEDSDLR